MPALYLIPASLLMTSNAVFAAPFYCVLLDSRPACKEGPGMDPLRFPDISHPPAPD
jgi:hypothetical protein